MLFLISLFLMVVCSNAQIPGSSPCGETQGMSNYDPSKLLGEWYGYGTYLDCTPKGRCMRVKYTGLPDGSTVDNDRQLSTIPGSFEAQQSAVILTYLGDGTYNVSEPQDSTYFNFRLVVWGTDYESYYVKGSCINAGAGSLHYAWAATRSRNPSRNVTAKIDETLNSVGLSKEYMYIYDHSDCPSDF